MHDAASPDTESFCRHCGIEFVDPQPIPAFCSERCRKRGTECIEGPEGCRGPVELRDPGYGFKSYPRCERHGAARIEREHENRRRYSGPEPVDFDSADAGEVW